MEVRQFMFPMLAKNDLADIEMKLCNLINKYREGDLAPEEKDWMDWANNVLQTTNSMSELRVYT